MNTPVPAEPRSMFAHEVVPEPHPYAPLVEHTRYHLARAQAFWVAFMEADSDRRNELRLAIAAAQYALLLVALYDGLTGDDAFRWAYARVQGGDAAGVWLWEAGVRLQVGMESIRAYRA